MTWSAQLQSFSLYEYPRPHFHLHFLWFLHRILRCFDLWSLYHLKIAKLKRIIEENVHWINHYKLNWQYYEKSFFYSSNHSTIKDKIHKNYHWSWCYDVDFSTFKKIRTSRERGSSKNSVTCEQGRRRGRKDFANVLYHVYGWFLASGEHS